MKINKKNHDIICSAINTMLVSQSCMTEARRKDDIEQFNLWYESKNKAIESLKTIGIDYKAYLAE